ncbi:MAG: tetratricopeptide repeat protein [Candidatus Paceibacterota bacterium]|jgi:tetratricopeptide (TPR) repeat protein
MAIPPEVNVVKIKRPKPDVLSFIALQALLFLTPLFFVPIASIPFQGGKNLFLILGVSVVFVLWLVARLKDGVLVFPRSLFYASSGLLAATYVLAGIFSGNRETSFAGQSFDLGTLAFFIPSILLFALVPLVIRSRERILCSYATLLASFLVAAVFHALHVFFPGALSLGLLSRVTDNLVGGWSDLGIFFGLSALLSMLSLERASLGRMFRILALVCFVASLGMVTIVNFSTIWIVLSSVSLVFFVYELSVGKKMAYYALVTLVVSVSFIIGGGRIGGFISNTLGTGQTEVRPSLSTTVQVAKSTLMTHPLFGTGPNRFSSDWLLHRPDGINQTQFWNMDFNYGIGFMPSILTTTGVIGSLAVLAFLVLFLLAALKTFFKEGSTRLSRHLVISSFVGAAYLWVFSFVYVPSPSIWLLTMFLTGLFISALREDKILGDISLKTFDRPSANFVSVLLIVFFLIGSLAFLYFTGIRFAAMVYFQKAAIALNIDGNPDKAQAYLVKASSFAPIDAYSRALAQINLSRIGALLNDSKLDKDTVQKLFQQYLSVAIQSANQSMLLDPTNYANYASLGQVLESVIPLKIQGAYEGSKQAYTQALALNPGNPELYLDLARIEVAKGDNDAARAELSKAFGKKGDYADAIYLLAQIQMGEKDVDGAISSVSALATLSPSDSGVFFQLGLLYYDQKRYSDAEGAFERALAIDPQYANAKYLLGLSYYQTGGATKALVPFHELAVTNPQNADIKFIIANLQAGKAPLAPAAATSTKSSKSKRGN